MITLPTSMKILEKEPKRLLFEIKPLYPGYGITLGNALRRVLLSSIEGAAITQIKIKGVPSEFSVIKGVKESVLDIILNLKQVKLKLFGEEPQIIELKVSGEKEVKARDIKTPPQVEIVNKDLHIASLTSPKIKLEIEMKVKKGFGYVEAEELKEEKSPVGVIALDAIFSPVVSVAFWVENIRFEKRTDYNKLKMEVETNGSVDPEETVKEACKVLVQHFGKVKEFFGEKEEIPLAVSKALARMTLKDFKFSNRILKILKESHIKTLSQLLAKSEKELQKLKGLGEKGLQEIKRKLKKKKLKLKD